MEQTITSHAKRTNFETLIKSIHGVVRFRDGSKVCIEGKGSILFQCNNCEKRLLQDVYYILSFCTSIISLRQLAAKGDKILMLDPFFGYTTKMEGS